MIINAMAQAGISRFQMLGQLKRCAIRRDARGCASEWRVLRDFAFPALLAGLLVTPAHWLCQAMLANTPNGYNELAVLGVAMQWINVVLFLPGVLARVVLPMLTELVTHGNHLDARRLLMLAIGANAAVAVPIAIIAIMFSSRILRLYGPDFQNGTSTMTYAVITAALLSMQAPVGSMVAASSRMWLGARLNLGWALVYVSLAFVLVDYGSPGVSGAMGIAYVVHSAWTFAFAFNQTRGAPSIQRA